MSRLRIVCKGEPFQPTKPSGLSLSTPAYWPDVCVTLIADDGTEHAITNVTRVLWSIKQGNEPAAALLEFEDVDVELEADFGAPSAAARDAVVEAARAWARGDEGSLTRLMKALEGVGP